MDHKVVLSRVNVTVICPNCGMIYNEIFRDRPESSITKMSFSDWYRFGWRIGGYLCRFCQ